jgi:hypothetical protein
MEVLTLFQTVHESGRKCTCGAGRVPSGTAPPCFYFMAQELQVIQDYYTLTVMLLSRVQAFPRNLRHGLGRSIEKRVEQILADLIRAKYAIKSNKAPILREVNVELEVLRFQLRQAVDLKGLAFAAQKSLLEQVQKVGRQVGAWLKTTSVPATPVAASAKGTRN